MVSTPRGGYIPSRMIDVAKHAAYWLEGAREDWAVAGELLAKGRSRHGLFFVHLALEKALKAVACRATDDLAPRTHNLIRLAQAARLTLDRTQRDILAEANAFNVEGRYPEALGLPPKPEEALAYLNRARSVFEWLTSL